MACSWVLCRWPWCMRTARGCVDVDVDVDAVRCRVGLTGGCLPPPASTAGCPRAPCMQEDAASPACHGPSGQTLMAGSIEWASPAAGPPLNPRPTSPPTLRLPRRLHWCSRVCLLLGACPLSAGLAPHDRAVQGGQAHRRGPWRTSTSAARALGVVRPPPRNPAALARSLFVARLPPPRLLLAIPGCCLQPRPPLRQQISSLACPSAACCCERLCGMAQRHMQWCKVVKSLQGKGRRVRRQQRLRLGGRSKGMKSGVRECAWAPWECWG